MLFICTKFQKFRKVRHKPGDRIQLNTPPKAGFITKTASVFVFVCLFLYFVLFLLMLFFSPPLSSLRIFVFKVKSVHPIDQYQKGTPTCPNPMSLHEFKKPQLQKRFTLLTYDSIGCLQTLCINVL